MIVMGVASSEKRGADAETSTVEYTRSRLHMQCKDGNQFSTGALVVRVLYMGWEVGRAYLRFGVVENRSKDGLTF